MPSLANRRTLDIVGAPVFLCGMMGSGKTAVGRALAARIGATFIDLDGRIERIFGISIPEAFARGEVHFRALEVLALRTLLDEPAFAQRQAVVATGGGTIVDPINRARMDAAGRRVLLRVSPEGLAARLDGEEARGRPLIASERSSLERLRALWDDRREAYQQGAYIVDAEGSVDEVAQRVVEALDLETQTGDTSP